MHMMNWLKKIMPLILLNLLRKQIINAKIKNIKDKIPSMTNLATTAAVNAVENEILDVRLYWEKQIIMTK